MRPHSLNNRAATFFAEATVGARCKDRREIKASARVVRILAEFVEFCTEQSKHERQPPMKRSTERILTTHVGSLPRPADLRAMWAKKAVTAEDEVALQTRLRSAIGEVVRAQKERRHRNSQRRRVRQADARGHRSRRLGQLHFRPPLRLHGNFGTDHRTRHC